MNNVNFLMKSTVRRRKNPVARNLNTFNRSEVHRDRKHDYKRKPKYGLGWDQD